MYVYETTSDNRLYNIFTISGYVTVVEVCQCVVWLFAHVHKNYGNGINYTDVKYENIVTIEPSGVFWSEGVCVYTRTNVCAWLARPTYLPLDTYL